MAELSSENEELRAELREAERRIVIRLGAWVLTVWAVGLTLLRLTL